MHLTLLRRGALGLAALLALVVPVAASAATPAAPIPSDPRDPTVQSFAGKPVQVDHRTTGLTAI